MPRRSPVREAFMMIRSMALFAHVVGMLVLFVGMTLEWLSLEGLLGARVWRALPRFMAGAVGVILVSGVYLASRVGVFDQGWVRVSLGSMVAMGILGGP